MIDGIFRQTGIVISSFYCVFTLLLCFVLIVLKGLIKRRESSCILLGQLGSLQVFLHTKHLQLTAHGSRFIDKEVNILSNKQRNAAINVTEGFKR